MGLSKIFQSVSKRKIMALIAPFSLAATGCVYTNMDMDVKEVVQNSGNVLTFEQARNRIAASKLRSSARLPDYFNTRRHARIYYSNCIQADYSRAQVPKGLEPLWNAVQAARNSDSIISQNIVPQTISADHFLCYVNLPKNILGQWHFRETEGVVRMQCRAEDDPSPFLLTTYIHETIHSVQSDRRDQITYRNWQLRDMQLAMLSRESAARVGGYVAAFEMSLTTGDRTWERNAGRQISDVIKNTYAEKRAEGMDHKTAIEHTGSATWQSYFQGTPWLDQHNISFINNALSYFQNGGFVKFSGRGYSLQHARHSGYINKDLNITRFIDRLPTKQEMHGNNPRIRNILQFMELEQIRILYGTKDARYKTQRAEAVRNSNPYLNVDMKNIDRSAGAPDVLTQFDMLAGIHPTTHSIQAGIAKRPHVHGPAARSTQPLPPAPVPGRGHCLTHI